MDTRISIQYLPGFEHPGQPIQCAEQGQQLIDEHGTIPSYQASNLCHDCGQIDFKSINQRQAITVLRDGGVPDCELCQFFDELKMTPQYLLDSTSPITYKIVHNPTLYEKMKFNVFLVTATAELFRSSDIHFTLKATQSIPQSYGRIVEPRLNDFSQIRTWLDFCDKEHTNLCARRKNIAGLNFIDCESRQLVNMDISPDRYATLSYVWGPLSPNLEPGKLPLEMGKTIEDSIEVANALGIRYLWVDRYCIPQHNHTEKGRQLRLMGDIYANSYLTIIAAAGDDVEFGLSGMSRDRKKYPSISLEALKLVPIAPVKIEFIQSKWYTRGWTYQEGLLARRRLVFTESEIYFQCTEMHCRECLEFPLLSSAFGAACHEIFPQRGIGEQADDIFNRIDEYVYRELTCPSDILDAFEGVLKAYESFQVRHLWGIVVLSSSEPHNNSISFEQSLCWVGLHRATRRSQFPSWSWTGWIIESSCGTSGLIQYYWRDTIFTAQIESSRGTACSLEDSDWFKDNNISRHQAPPVLALEAWTTANIGYLLHTPSATSIYTIDKASWMEDALRDVAGYAEFAGKVDSSSIEIIAMLMSKSRETSRVFFDIAFLYWEPNRELYERLPHTGTCHIDDLTGGSFSKIPISDWKGNEGILGGWKFTRNRIRLG